MHNGVGHHIPYHKSVGVAAALNGWEHFAVYSKEEVIQDLPKKWLPCLSKKGLYVHLGKHFFWFPLKFTLKMYGIINFTFLFKSLINGLRIRNEAIIFFDDPAPAHIMSIFFSILSLKKKNINIWIMFRTPVYEKFSRLYLYKAILFASKKILGNEKITILTDSKCLEEKLKIYFFSEIYLMPIPHTLNPQYSNIYQAAVNDIPVPEIKCWWPGAPREEKGLDHIQALSKKLNEFIWGGKLVLMLSEKVKISEQAKVNNIIRLREPLSRFEYEQLMAKSKFILLPYDPREYSERTSGIFVEAVCAGAIPLVTKNTWMAKELENFGLQELTLEWVEPDLIGAINKVFHDSTIKELFQKMIREYSNNHGETAYALKMSYLKDRLC
jgi:hypothetical protein